MGEAGGVLDAEAHSVEGVGGEVAGFGEAFFLVLGGFVLGIAAVEEVDGSAEGGGVFIEPAVVVEGVGMEKAGGVNFASAFDLAGEIGGFVDADLELAAEADVVPREREVGTAAGTGKQALHFGESLDLLLSHLADFANGPALGDAAMFDELDLCLEARGEDDVRLASDGIFLREAAGDGGAGDGIDESAAEEFCVANQNANGKAESAVGRHGGEVL